MMRALSFIVVMVCSVLYSNDLLATCSVEQAKQAEEQASSVTSFNALHQSFKEFGACDDGAIGEGYSDSVARLLIIDWLKIASLQQAADADRPFGAFVLKHVDELMSPTQLEKIDELARLSCPKEAQKLCSAIKGRIEQIRKIGREQLK
jgi:hypothetical protein